MGQGIQAWTPSKVCGRQPLKNLKSYDLHWGVHFIYLLFFWIEKFSPKIEN